MFMNCGGSSVEALGPTGSPHGRSMSEVGKTSELVKFTLYCM